MTTVVKQATPAARALLSQATKKWPKRSKKSDCAVLFKTLRDDPRVKYLIHNGKIWSKEKGERAYTGLSPHTHHIHVSIKDGMGNDTSPWFKEGK